MFKSYKKNVCTYREGRSCNRHDKKKNQNTLREAKLYIKKYLITFSLHAHVVLYTLQTKCT